MSTAAALRSGKTFRDENFPVASRLIEPQFRRPIMAFYEFVRTADDVADHARLSPEEKLAALDTLEESLLGRGDDEPVGVTLHDALAERGLPAKHARDLIAAFRLDAGKQRYRSWEELIDYCRRSAMPVGRFVLDVHGEARSTWPASDALCAALQIINHLQDCADDYRALDRVYLPLDLLDRHGAAVTHLAEPRTSPALRACLDELCERVSDLLRESAGLAARVRHTRLALEISVIQRLAEQLVQRIKRCDPLAERAVLGIVAGLRSGFYGLLAGASTRIGQLALRRAGGGTSNEGDGQVSTASGSTFYAAMRILPRDKRRAIFSVYAFCRAVDDIADQAGDRGMRLASLDRWRADIDGLYEGRIQRPLAPLAKAIGDFHLRREDFHSVIDGMQMDVEADIFAPTYATLDLYCDRVASAVGRLCVQVFEVPETTGIQLAHDLGRALQFTNILRDIDEDAAIGRLYLPRELLSSAGIDPCDARAVLRHPALGEACERLARPALAYFDQAEEVMRTAAPATVRCARIMAGAYRSLLVQLQQRGWMMPRERVRLSRWRIAGIVLRSYLLA